MKDFHFVLILAAPVDKYGILILIWLALAFVQVVS